MGFNIKVKEETCTLFIKTLLYNTGSLINLQICLSKFLRGKKPRNSLEIVRQEVTLYDEEFTQQGRKYPCIQCMAVQL